jgi:hypothetical protein
MNLLKKRLYAFFFKTFFQEYNRAFYYFIRTLPPANTLEQITNEKGIAVIFFDSERMEEEEEHYFKKY